VFTSGYEALAFSARTSNATAADTEAVPGFKWRAEISAPRLRRRFSALQLREHRPQGCPTVSGGRPLANGRNGDAVNGERSGTLGGERPFENGQRLLWAV
jgi:hypothetical protein